MVSFCDMVYNCTLQCDEDMSLFHCKNGLVKLTNHWLPQFHLLFSLFIYREARRCRMVL